MCQKELRSENEQIPNNLKQNPKGTIHMYEVNGDNENRTGRKKQ